MRATLKRLTRQIPSSQFGRFIPLYPPKEQITSFPQPFPVPAHIPIPHYVPRDFWSIHTGLSPLEPVSLIPEGGRIDLGTEEELKVRKAAALARDVLKQAGEMVKPGVTTAEIDKRIHKLIISKGAYPSPLGYSAFPKSLCSSVNNVIAHGIPDDRPLDSHDLVNLDITLYLDGYHGDTSATFMLPDLDSEGRELCQVAREALEKGISVCGPGVPYSQIGEAIESFTESQGFLVSDLFSGHGISRVFHHPPWVLHNRNTEQDIMQPGDCFTIEPSIEQIFIDKDGDIGGGHMWDDGWTVVTKAGARSAQYEHQVLITPNGVDVLTR